MSNDDNGDSRYSFPTRRNVLRTVGAGTTLAALGGVATGDSHTDDGGQNGSGASGGTNSEHDCPPCIDDLMGYASLTRELDVPSNLQPAHTVELRIDDADVLFPEETEGHPDFYFDPVGLAVEAGDVVEFPNVSDLHTVTAMHPRFLGLPQRIPDGAAPFSSPPVVSDENWLYRFTEHGVYDLLCLPHFELGMVMRIVVTKEGCGMPEGPSKSEMLPPPVSAVLDADALAPANIVDNGPVAWADLKGQIPTFNPEDLSGGEGGNGGGEGGNGGGEGGNSGGE